jgi:hypothetical protein
MASVISSTLLALGESRMKHKWREEDILYRNQLTKQFLLTQKDRLVDLRSRGLNTISNHSALMAGFTIVMFVELQLTPNVPSWLVVAYAGVSALVCCLLSLTMIQTMLVLTAVSQRSQMMQNTEEFNKFWVDRCDKKWRSTFRWFAAAVPIFLVDIAIVGWVKFYDTPSAAATITVICVIAIIIWSFDQYFWGSYIATVLEYQSTEPATVHQSISDYNEMSNIADDAVIDIPTDAVDDGNDDGNGNGDGNDNEIQSNENKV